MKRLSGLLAAFLVFLSIAARSHADPEQRTLVRFRPDVSSVRRAELLTNVGASKIGEVYGDDVWVVGGSSASAISRLPGVVYAERDKPLSILLAAPDDAEFKDQYALKRINAVRGWSSFPKTYSPRTAVSVAVIDTGIDFEHPDLAGRIDSSDAKCFGSLCFLNGVNDDRGHGTHTSGTIAAVANNHIGVAGVAFNASVMPLRACNIVGICNTSDVASAINWARDHRARVISMSLGGDGSDTLAEAVRSAYASGVVLVGAAGNNGNSGLVYPGAYKEVISVAATDQEDKHASFSNTNADVELAAPGVSVLSTWNNDDYTTATGTSMSAPHVAGLAALLFAQHPTWTNKQVRARMDACSDDLGARGRDTEFGYGRINLGRALGKC